MKILDLDKLGLYLPKIIDSYEGFSFKDFEDNNTLFISDTLSLTSLMSDYIGKFKFSKKSNRKIFLNKYIRTGKVTLARDLVKSRSKFLKSQAILETDKDSADCYDLSLENITYRKIYNENQGFAKINTLLKDDDFIKRNNLNVFWLLSNQDIDSNVTDYDFEKSTLMISRIHKDFMLNPNINKNIKAMYIMIPFDSEETKDVMDVKFYLFKCYERDKEAFSYPKLHSAVTKGFLNVSKLAKKKLFVSHAEKLEKDESSRIDNTYNVYDENNLTLNKNLNKSQPVVKDTDIESLKVFTKDKSQLKETTFDQLKQTYMEKDYNKEIKSLFESGIKNFIPSVELKEHKIEDAFDGTTEQERHTFKIRDIENGKEKEISLMIPKLIDDKFFKIYDKKYILSNQVYSNLVNKIKDDTVAFTSAYTKTIIYTQGKMDDKLGKYLAKRSSIQSINPYISSDNKDIPNSLHAIFKHTTAFYYKDYLISYDIYRANFIIENEHERLHPKRIVIGIHKNFLPNNTIMANKDKLFNYIKDLFAKNGKDSVLIYNCSIDSINNKPFLLEMKNYLSSFEPAIKKMPIPGSSQFARMNISGKKVPVLITMLIYYNYINPSNRLDEFFQDYFRENVHIEIVDKSTNNDNVISIKLADGYINVFIFDSLIGSELLFSILRKIDMSKYKISDLTADNDIRLLLYSYFESQKLQPDVAIDSIANGIISILDPITKDMIEKSNYEYPLGNDVIKPKDIIEILYYCIYLLNDRTHKSGNDFSGYRIRNMETIPAIIYKIVSNKAAAAKKESESKIKNKRKAIDAFSVPLNEVIEEFRNLTTFESFSDLNIANELGLTSKATYKGFGGMNNNRSISYDLRATDPSAIGYIDMGNNVDNTNVGSNRMMPFNPNIKDIRGSEAKIKNLRKKVMNNETLTDEETSSLLSFDTYIEPYVAAHADAPRISMTSIQARHGIPLSKYDDLPIKTGIEESVKNVVSSSFVIKTPKNNGPFKVKSIDENKKVISLLDKSNKSVDVSYADKVVNNSGGGFHHLKEFEPCVKVNDKVDNNQPIALDKGSFKNGNYTNAKLMRTTLLNFAETLEDGAIVSESAAKELEFNYVTEKAILIRNDQTILKMIDKIGEEISVGSPLLIFSKDDEDSEMNSIFGDINKDLEESEGLGLNTYIKSKYPGKIVDIKIQYNGNLRKIKALDNCIKHLPKENVQQIQTDRIAGEIAPNGILIKYYILTKIPAMTGSKTTAQSTKSVFVVWPDDKMPRTLDGERIDYVFSTFSCITRIISFSLDSNI